MNAETSDAAARLACTSEARLDSDGAARAGVGSFTVSVMGSRGRSASVSGGSSSSTLARVAAATCPACEAGCVTRCSGAHGSSSGAAGGGCAAFTAAFSGTVVTVAACAGTSAPSRGWSLCTTWPTALERPAPLLLPPLLLWPSSAPPCAGASKSRARCSAAPAARTGSHVHQQCALAGPKNASHSDIVTQRTRRARVATPASARRRHSTACCAHLACAAPSVRAARAAWGAACHWRDVVQRGAAACFLPLRLKASTAAHRAASRACDAAAAPAAPWADHQRRTPPSPPCAPQLTTAAWASLQAAGVARRLVACACART